MANKTIPALPTYGSQDTDKIKKDLLEITKNDGTYGSPTYGTGASRKISIEELKTALNISSTIVNDYQYATSSITLAIETFYTLNLSSNIVLTLPTITVDDYFKCIILYLGANSSYTATFSTNSEVLKTVGDSIIYIATADGWLQSSRDISKITQTVTNGVTDKSPSEDAVYDFVTGLGLDKICPNLVTLVSNTYTALANDNIKADAQSIGSDVNITIPTASIAGRLIYVYYPTGSPSAYTVNLIGGFSATLVQLDYFLIRDNGTYWEAIASTQNVPDLSPYALLSSAITDGDTTHSPDGNAVFDALALKQNSLGYTAENIANKSTSVITDQASNVKYPTVKSVYDWATGLFATISNLALKSNIASPTFTGTVTTPDLLVSSATASTPTFFDATKKLITTTAQLWGTWVQTWSNKATPVDADTLPIYNSDSTFVGVKSTLLNFWTAYLLPKVQSLGYLSGSGTTNTFPIFTGSGTIGNSAFTYEPSVGKYNLFGKVGGVGANTKLEIYNEANQTTIGFYRNTSTLDSTILSTSNSLNLTHNTGGIFLSAFAGNSSVGMYTSTIQYTTTLYHMFFCGGALVGYFSNASLIMHKDVDIQGTAKLYSAGGIYTGSSSLSASAILQADSTTKGFLPPRMTTAQKELIADVEGLVVYDTDLDSLCQNDGVSWTTLGIGKGFTTSSATPTINTDSINYYELTAQAVDITSFTTNLTGTPKRGQKLWIDITGTGARAITWGASFEASTIALPTTTVSTNKLSVGFIWNVATSKWRCIGSC